MISQAWDRHLADKKKVSLTSQQMRELLETQWMDEMEGYMNEVFMTQINFPSSKRLVKEIFTTTQRVHRAAQKRGHRASRAVSLETGFNLLDDRDQQRAMRQLAEVEPYFVVLAFPCSFWSQLMFLNGIKKNFRGRKRDAIKLLKFALSVAQLQVEAGRHVIYGEPTWLTCLEATLGATCSIPTWVEVGCF